MGVTKMDKGGGAGGAAGSTTGEAIPRIGPSSSLKDLLTGAAFPLRALSLIWRTPALRSRVCLMSLAAFACLVVLAVGLLWWAPALVDALWTTAEAWYARLSRTLLKIVAYAALFAVGACSLPSLLLVPLTDPLSEATERALGDETPPQTWSETFRETWRSLVNMAARVLVFAAGHLLLLPLNLIPGAGGALWSCLAWLWSAVWLALAQLDIPMARHLRSFPEAFAAFARRKLLFLGFGSAMYVLLWLPVLNALLIPLAVVSATMLMRSLEDAGVLTPRPSPQAPSKAAQGGPPSQGDLPRAPPSV